jgi:enoyl-CoA hydratase
MSLRYSCEGGVARLVLDAPERRNALDFTTLSDIVRAVRCAEGSASCLVLAAEGPVFSAGADFADLTGTSADTEFDSAVSRAGEALRRSHLPVIAAVQGPCLGAAVDLVSSADIVIAATAARFEVPAIRLGILYNPPALERMRGRLTGSLLRALMLGVPVTATDAMAGGLVARVVEPDALSTAVSDATQRLVEANRAAGGATKELLNALDDGTFVPGQWHQLRLRLLDTPDRYQVIASRKRPTETAS